MPLPALCCGSVLQAGLVDLADAAAHAGFTEITVWPTLVSDAEAAGSDRGSLRRRLDDLGVRIIELDPVCTWLPVEIPDTAPTARFATFSVDDFFRMADEFGVDALNVIRGDDADVSDAEMIEHLGRLADRAAAADLRVQLEFLPWSPVADLDHALRIVEGVGRDNCGVHVDVWHLVRSGGTPEQLSTLSPETVAAVQLSDLDPTPWDNLLVETTGGRRLPGDGDGSAVRAIDALTSAEIDAPLSLEVFSSELMSLPPRDAGARLAAAAARLHH